MMTPHGPNNTWRIISALLLEKKKRAKIHPHAVERNLVSSLFCKREVGLGTLAGVWRSRLRLLCKRTDTLVKHGYYPYLQSVQILW
jgi:hypothetical protein